MRTEQRLSKVEQQVQQRLQQQADRRVNQIIADLSEWTAEELEEAIRAIQNEPPTPEFQAYQAWLTTLTDAELQQEHDMIGWPEASKEGRRALSAPTL